MHGTKKKILIADPDPLFLKKAAHLLKQKHYLVETVSCGIKALSRLNTFAPDLIIAELFLPQIHGIEILKKIKQDARTKHIGVILTNSNLFSQNYHAALKLGCDFFLEKPFPIAKLSSIASSFFKGDLVPAPFSGKTSAHSGKKYYVPKPHPSSSYLRFWGTRGSNPVSGPNYTRFGGNTSCLEIRHNEDLIIVDAGTGIRPLGYEIGKQKNIHVLLSHAHWDHLSGFPFFTPLFDPSYQITIWAPMGFEKSIHELFTEMLTYDFFPIRLDDVRASITFKEIQEGTPFSIGDITVNSQYAHHPGSTLMFKFQVGKTSFAYATDNEFLMGYHGHPKAITASHPLVHPYKSLIDFFKKCDFVIHEAQYTPEEYLKKVGWGHSSVANAMILMKLAKVKHWILTHHDPKHTDLALLQKIQLQHEMIDECGMDCHLRMASDGMIIPLHGHHSIFEML
ncbi:MAG: hypothetical protein RLZZ453_450 [Chlamydiota bacterium]|jgi:CheY-like chemotaxis protein